MEENGAQRPSKIKFIFLQFVGKFRRFYLGHFQKTYVKEQLEKRTGECTRCGACCKILFRCPFYALRDNEEGEEEGYCKIYNLRFEQCELYPIDPRDFREIDQECGYSFISEENIEVVS